MDRETDGHPANASPEEETASAGTTASAIDVDAVYRRAQDMQKQAERQRERALRMCRDLSRMLASHRQGRGT